MKVLSLFINKKYSHQERPVWISMSICVSENAPHKAHYNYQAALVVSSFLWRNIFRARVLVTLVTERNHDRRSLESLYKTLGIMGVEVIVLEQEENISCVLMAQTARILAYNHPEVGVCDDRRGY